MKNSPEKALITAQELLTEFKNNRPVEARPLGELLEEMPEHLTLVLAGLIHAFDNKAIKQPVCFRILASAIDALEYSMATTGQSKALSKAKPSLAEAAQCTGFGQEKVKRFLQQVSAFFELHGESRFTLMGKKNRRPTINRAGFRNNINQAEPLEGEEYEYFVFPSTYNNEICKGFDPRWCTQVLIEKGLLKPGSDNKAAVVRWLPGLGKAARCYHFPTGQIAATT